MAHDLIIRGGIIVDGTGASKFIGDVPIAGDRITSAVLGNCAVRYHAMGERSLDEAPAS